MWAAVRQITNSQRTTRQTIDVTAEDLNKHYAAISTDDCHIPPMLKQTASYKDDSSYISDRTVFQILDKLSATATGLDDLPAWFLRLGAPVFCKPIARLFNLSLVSSTVPLQ